MTTYTEYRALMFRNGKWEDYSPRFKNKDNCMAWVQGKVKNYKQCGITLPDKWQIQCRKVTVTDWIEYA